MWQNKSLRHILGNRNKERLVMNMNAKNQYLKEIRIKYHSENILDFLKHLCITTNTICSSHLKAVIPIRLSFIMAQLVHSKKRSLYDLVFTCDFAYISMSIFKI